MELPAFLDRVVAPGEWLAIASKRAGSSLNHKFFRRSDIAAAAAYTGRQARVADTWFALASFKTPNNRKHDNVENLKCFWLDADVKRPGDNKDPTKVFAGDRDVAAWIKQFCVNTTLPLPNLWVKSGYGVHIYWVLADALTREQWQPYAQALKALLVAHSFLGDIGVVADASRILRPVGTQNFKIPARPVPCFILRERPDHPNGAVLDVLVKPAGGIPGTPPTTRSSGGSLAAAQAGVEYPPADFAAVAAGCNQVKTSLDAGGVSDTRDLWWRLLTLATCCTDGRHWAHELGKRDPRYTEAETDREYDRAAADKQRKGIGAPLCTSFETDRPGICQACPHHRSSVVTTPYRLGFITKPADDAGDNDDDNPPEGFRYGKTLTGQIELQRIAKKKWLSVFSGTIDTVFLDDVDGVLRITFTYTAPGGRQRTIAVKNNELTDDRTSARLLAERGIHIMPDCVRGARKLIMAWIDKLNNACRVRGEPLPSFGWYKPNGKYRGFAAGGVCYMANGREETIRGDDAGLLRNYTPTGTFGEWQKAAKFIAGGVPELHTAIATSFGAPLLQFTGESGGAISFIGKSAVGKSSAFKAGVSVWGRPVGTMLQLDDTQTYKFLVMSGVRALPIYWDEARIDHDKEKQLADAIHLMTQGRDRGRGTADVKTRTPGEWSTLCSIAANNSISDIITDQRGAGNETLVRILEVHIKRDPPAYNPDAGTIVQMLNSNYGEAGKLYARFITGNVPLIEDHIRRVRADISAKLSTDNTERFYVAMTSATVVGAYLANKQGILELDHKLVRKVLCDAILAARQLREGYVPMAHNERLSKILDEFLRDYSNVMVVTRTMAGPGPRPNATQLGNILRQPPDNYNKYGITGGLAYHLSVDDKLLRVSKDHWREWCRKRAQSPDGLRDEMGKLWGLQVSRGNIGCGTSLSHRTYYFELSLAHPDLAALLDPYQETARKAGAVVALRPAP